MAEVIITSSILIGLLLFMRRLCRDKISRRLQYSLWLLAAFRLLMPVALFENPFHIMNGLQPAADQMEEWAAETTIFSETQQPAFNGKTSSIENGLDCPAPFSPSPPEVFAEQLSREKQGTSLLLRKPYAQNAGPAGFPLRQLLQTIWYAGMAVIGGWMLFVNLLCRYRLSRRRILLDAEGRVKIYMSENAGVSCLSGVLYPVIYLTPGCAQIPRYKEYTIAHELTHYRHGDHIWTFLRNLCLIIHWFNPLVWVGAKMAARDCELACDEGVLRLLSEEQAQDYGYTLIEMAASFRRPWLLCCETTLASGKQELKVRITRIAAVKKRTNIPAAFLAVFCSAMLAACTFGSAKAAPVMGRYTESTVPLSGTNKGKLFYAISREENTIRLIAETGFDVLSSNGITFETVKLKDMPSGTWELYRKSAIYRAGSIKGARAFCSYLFPAAEGQTAFANFVITEEGEEIRLDALEGNDALYFFSNGSFFIEAAADSASRYYQLSPVTGEIRLLTESSWNASYMAADDHILYLVNETGVLLYDLGTGEARQDQVLSDFVAEHATVSPLSGEYPALLQPYDNGVYILTHSGLYWHELYTKDVVQVIDGASCSIGNTGREFTDIALRETGGKPDFLILYDRNELVRYTYDASLPAVPEE